MTAIPVIGMLNFLLRPSLQPGCLLIQISSVFDVGPVLELLVEAVFIILVILLNSYITRLRFLHIVRRSLCLRVRNRVGLVLATLHVGLTVELTVS